MPRHIFVNLHAAGAVSDFAPCLTQTSAVFARRLTAYELAVRGSRMPCAPEGLKVGPDNVTFRERLRRLYPASEDAMQEQREACVQARSYP